MNEQIKPNSIIVNKIYTIENRKEEYLDPWKQAKYNKIID
jgi:hypothetical protein